MRVTLAIPVAGLLAGAAIGLRWPEVPTAWLGAVLCGWTLLAVHAGRVGQPALIAISACGAFAVGGAALSADAWRHTWRSSLRVAFEAITRDARAEALQRRENPPEEDSAATVLIGRLRSDASLNTSGTVSLAVDVEWIGRAGSGNGRTDPAANPVTGGVLLTVVGSLGAEHLKEWRAGRRIRAPADLRRVARYLDPGVPDQERLLSRRGIALVGTVKSAVLVSVIARGSLVDEAAARIRSLSRRAISDSVGPWSARAAAVVTAIVIGDRTGLDPELERRLQESGTYHVIAISGGNIALLAGLTLVVFRIAGILGRTAMLCAAAALVAYGSVVGGGASVNRAVLMAVVYFSGRAWDLRGPPFQALVLVAGVLVLVDPLSVADPASLLTFGATVAILAASPLMSPERLPRVVAPAAVLLIASAAAEAALMPVAAFFFSRVTFAGLLLNFGAIPLMAVAQLAGMAVIPLHALSHDLARLAGLVACVGAEGLLRTADLVRLAPWSTWRVAPPGALSIVVYYAALGGAWFSWSRRALLVSAATPPSRPRTWTRRANACVAVAIAAGFWMLIAPPSLVSEKGDGRLHVTFIDTGQGDAALVRFPRGASMLIDAGGLPGTSTFDIGDRVVGPVLRHAGVRRLGTLVLTHADADHVGGARSVLRDFLPWDVWEGVPVPRQDTLQQLQVDALDAHARWTTLQTGDAMDIDGVRLTVLHPPPPDWERQDVRNDDSIVIELRWRDVSFVFSGDIGRETEAAIAPLLQPARLRVLKVPHHGSTTSSSEAFIRALSPDVAVISVGRSNNFGHPSPVVLERYQRANAAVFRTDQDGAVTVDTDGTVIEVSAFTGRHMEVKPPSHGVHRERKDVSRE